MNITVIAPVKNEFPWIGYSIMAAEPFVEEFCYGLASSDDGTRELLYHIKEKYLHERLRIFEDQQFDSSAPFWDFNPMNEPAYDAAYNYLIDASKGDACWFLHPDMIATKGGTLTKGPLAWWTTITSFAGDFNTKIVKGRGTRWKNIHAKKFGLHYAGKYGSVNEDFYHLDITGMTYKHYGEDFSKYPFEVADSGFKVNHYCELKPYRRRFEKMKLCLKTQFPECNDARIEEIAIQHPRVTLEESPDEFKMNGGAVLHSGFNYEKTSEPVPAVIQQYEDEFKSFKKELVYGQSV